MNESVVGQGLRRSGIAHEDLFVTTKLWEQHTGYQRTRQAIDDSLRRLQLDYMDLYLMSIGGKHGNSVGQVVLRSLVQHGVVALSKSVRKERVAENIEIFDFQLDDNEAARIATLETGTRSFFSHGDRAIVEWMSERRLDI